MFIVVGGKVIIPINKSYSDGKYPLGLLKKSICSILPIYYFFIIATVLTLLFEYNTTVSVGSIVTSLLFVNVLFGSWGNAIGGSLYFSCLVIAWILYLGYMKWVNSTKRSIVCGLAVVFLSLFAIRCAYAYLPETYILNVTYFARCISSFAVGHMVYFIVSSDVYNKLFFSKIVVYLLDIFLIASFGVHFIFFEVSLQFFLMFVALLLMVNYKNSPLLICNPVFVYIGKRIFYIFCWHILLNRALGQCLPMNYLFVLLILVLTIILSEVTYRIHLMRLKKNTG